MHVLSAHSIRDTDDFDPLDFPLATKELTDIKEMIKPQWDVDNKIIIVSYLKDHMIRSDLVQSHPELVKILTTKNACRFLEDLFLYSRINTRFRHSLENYVISQFNQKGTEQL